MTTRLATIALAVALATTGFAAHVTPPAGFGPRGAAAALGVTSGWPAAVRAAAPAPRGGGRAARQAPVFRGGIDLVNLGVTVTDRKANLITSLEPDDFEVYEDGTRQTIRHFAAGDAPGGAAQMHLGLMLDVSESMGDDMKFTKTAAIKFLNTLTDAVDITVSSSHSEQIDPYRSREAVHR